VWGLFNGFRAAANALSAPPGEYARVVRCWVKSRNERNPYPMLPARNGGDS